MEEGFSGATGVGYRADKNRVVSSSSLAPPALIASSDMSSSVASGDASSVSASSASVPSSPAAAAAGAPIHAVEYSSPLATKAAVEPQNPFDNMIEPSLSGSSDVSASGTTSALLQTPTRAGSATSPKDQTLTNSAGSLQSSQASTTTPARSSSTPNRQVVVERTPGNIITVSPVRTPPHPTAPTNSPAAQIAPPSLPRRNNTPVQSQQPPQPSPERRRMMVNVNTAAQLFAASSESGASTTEDDDENTAPSSAANTAERQLHGSDDMGHGPHHHHHHTSSSGNNTIARFLVNTRRRLSSARRDGDSEGENDDGALISGYLQKLGRNGKWQTRWFETDGECLSYYKSEKRTKLLATLDLQKVGLIEIDMDDPTECSFRIQVLGRLYHLRANSRVLCKDWVIMLNRIKEARMHQGNVKLVGSARGLSDLLDQSSSQNSTPRVVVVANRQRTRAVDEEEQWNEMIQPHEDDPSDPAYINQKRHSALGGAVVARWSKRRTSIQRLGTKLSKWARSLKKYSCADLERENVFLDQHVHPPGHDNKAKGGGSKGPSSWIDKEKSNNAQSAAAVGLAKPGVVKERTVSSASDYDRPMIS